MEENHLILFTGEECTHCKEVYPLIEKLEKETGIRVKRLEVWHNSKNAELLKKYDRDRCGGVPFLINIKTDDFICGTPAYDRLKAWALKK